MADGILQGDVYLKPETASPTISNDALLMTMLVDDRGKRDVAIADVTGAYLHADMLDYTLLKLEGEAVDIICKVNEKYNKLVCWERGKKVLHLRLLKNYMDVSNYHCCGMSCLQPHYKISVSS